MKEEQISELRMWLAFYFCHGLGSATLSALSQRVPLEELLYLKEAELRVLGCNDALSKALANPDWERVDLCLRSMEENDVLAVHYLSPDYPSLLKEISAPPLVLFCRGNTQLLSRPQIAVVGSRSASPLGCEIAASLSHRMASDGLVVTSGMASGIDGAAHKGALSASGPTIAVFGCGINVIYPKRHRTLSEQIIENGLLVSELPINTQPKSHYFPRRNRIIAGLSLGVLVVEAEIKSGSLITARYALEQNREVFAVPGSVMNPLTQGCHHLIKQGAKLVEAVEDIYEEVSFLPKNGLYNIKRDVAPKESDPLLKHLDYDATSVETLMKRTGWPIDKLLARLLDLELENRVEHVVGGYIKQGRR